MRRNEELEGANAARIARCDEVTSDASARGEELVGAFIANGEVNALDAGPALCLLAVTGDHPL